MKELYTLVGNVAKNFLRRGILLDIKGHYMKESDTLVGDVEKNLLRKKILLNIKGQYMKESNTLVGNATRRAGEGERTQYKAP